MRGKRFTRCGWGLMLVLLVAPTGCIFSPDNGGDGPGPITVTYPFPDSEDVLMSNFKKAYSNMNWDEYKNVLNNQFNFVFQQTDVEHLGLPSDRLTREEELQISYNMFNNRGEVPISKINFDVLDPEGSWQDIGSGHPDFPNSRRRVYRVLISIERPGDTTLEVEGLTEFFAVRRDSVVQGGAIKAYWELIGQIDRTIGAGDG